MKLKLADDAVKLAPWSLTKISTAAQCKLQFHYKYVEKLKDISKPKSDTKVGSAAHKSIELMLNGESLGRAFKIGSLQYNLDDKEMDDFLGFAGNLHDFLDRIKKFQEKRKIEHTYVEHQFGLTIDMKKTDFFSKDVFLRGAWDLSFFTPEKDLIILDHKTSKKGDTTLNAKYQSQLFTYAVAGRFLIPGLNGVQSAVHYMRSKEIVWDDYITVERVDDELVGWLTSFINSAIERLDTKEATPGWYCVYCPYTQRCEAYKSFKKE